MLYDAKCMTLAIINFCNGGLQISANCNWNAYSSLVITFSKWICSVKYGLKMVLIWWQRRMIWLVPACKFHFLQIAIKGNFSFLKYMVYLRFISIVRKFENLSTIFLLAFSSRYWKKNYTRNHRTELRQLPSITMVQDFQFLHYLNLRKLEKNRVR